MLTVSSVKFDWSHPPKTNCTSLLRSDIQMFPSVSDTSKNLIDRMAWHPAWTAVDYSAVPLSLKLPSQALSYRHPVYLPIKYVLQPRSLPLLYEHTLLYQLQFDLPVPKPLLLSADTRSCHLSFFSPLFHYVICLKLCTSKETERRSPTTTLLLHILTWHRRNTFCPSEKLLQNSSSHQMQPPLCPIFYNL